MNHKSFSFRARVWRYGGVGGWHFVTLPVEPSDVIGELYGRHRGFGSVKVRATIGSVVWETSIFPDKLSGAYILPLKISVRRTLHISTDDEVSVHLDLML